MKRKKLRDLIKDNTGFWQRTNLRNSDPRVEALQCIYKKNNASTILTQLELLQIVIILQHLREDLQYQNLHQALSAALPMQWRLLNDLNASPYTQYAALLPNVIHELSGVGVHNEKLQFLLQQLLRGLVLVAYWKSSEATYISILARLCRASPEQLVQRLLPRLLAWMNVDPDALCKKSLFHLPLLGEVKVSNILHVTTAICMPLLINYLSVDEDDDNRYQFLIKYSVATAYQWTTRHLLKTTVAECGLRFVGEHFGVTRRAASLKKNYPNTHAFATLLLQDIAYMASMQVGLYLERKISSRFIIDKAQHNQSSHQGKSKKQHSDNSHTRKSGRDKNFERKQWTFEKQAADGEDGHFSSEWEEVRKLQKDAQEIQDVLAKLAKKYPNVEEYQRARDAFNWARGRSSEEPYSNQRSQEKTFSGNNSPDRSSKNRSQSVLLTKKQREDSLALSDGACSPFAFTTTCNDERFKATNREVICEQCRVKPEVAREVLGVQRSDSATTIKRAYRGKSLLFHPDRCGNAEKSGEQKKRIKKECTEQFKLVGLAYEVLR